MAKRVSHPFTIHIDARHHLGGRFFWAIRRAGQVVREPAVTYETFENARLAGKAVLDQMAAAWKHEATSAPT